MKLFHLSHTDLDGYACQLVSSYYEPSAKLLNANYGPEVMAKIRFIKELSMSQSEPVWWLITDLNLTPDECAQVETLMVQAKNEGIDVNVTLLDHHISGKEASEKFEWYYLDNERSATKITRDFFAEKYSNALPKELYDLTDAVDAVDLWKEQSSLFEFGKVLMRAVTESKELSKLMFADESAAYKIAVIKNAAQFLAQQNAHIKLDDSIHFLKKEFLRESSDNSIDNLASLKITSLIAADLDKYTVSYGEIKGVFTMGIGNVSVIANAILRNSPERLFVIEYNGKGNASFRADGRVDVCEMAQKLANGGGHKNASGGKLTLGREFFNYEEAKAALQIYINQKLGIA